MRMMQTITALAGRKHPYYTQNPTEFLSTPGCVFSWEASGNFGEFFGKIG
jgi:hypothetical protein